MFEHQNEHKKKKIEKQYTHKSKHIDEDMWDIPSNNSKFCRKMKRKVINDQKKKKKTKKYL